MQTSMSVLMAPIAVNTCVTTHMAHTTAYALMDINYKVMASCVLVSSIIREIVSCLDHDSVLSINFVKMLMSVGLGMPDASKGVTIPLDPTYVTV